MDRISALMDGELEDREAEREFSRIQQEQGLRETWDVFHLIGDAVRGDSLLSPGFSHRLSETLQHEPTALAPLRRPSSRKITAYALSAAASLSAVAMVAWVATSTSTVGNQPEIAAAPAPILPEPEIVAVPAPAAPPLASVPDEGGMSEYLLAHQGISPSTAIQGVVPYIRSVSVRQGEIAR